VSIKGSDYRGLRDALHRGDLRLVKATAAQLPAINLEDALAIALLVIEHEPRNAERAARTVRSAELLARRGACRCLGVTAGESFCITPVRRRPGEGYRREYCYAHDSAGGIVEEQRRARSGRTLSEPSTFSPQCCSLASRGAAEACARRS
jgi:hypothetical protein